MSMFNQPSSGDWLKPADIPNHLVLITKVHEMGERFDNLAGRDKAYAVVDMADLDEPGQPLRQNISDNHPGIVNKLVKAYRSGEMVLGRIGQVATEKGNPAWVLGPFTPGHDDARASQWVSAHPVGVAAQPAPQTPPPAPVQPVPQAAPVPQVPPVQPVPTPQPAAPAQPLDPNNLPPEVQALLQQLGQQQTG